jgi:chemotaxis protein methyltransferase CheR
MIAGNAMGEIIPRAEQPHLEYLRQWIFDHTGLHFSEKKHTNLYRRLHTLCWKLNVPSLEELARQLRDQVSPHLAVEVACAVSTNHTFFYREAEVLQQVPQMILPRLPVEGQWRIWSAAAASGDEAYTLAILFAEALGLEQAQERVAILGTDISYSMIERAEQGIYLDQKLEMLPPLARQRYFEKVDARQWRVISELKQMCTFRRMNLQSTPFPFKNSFHLILCRNVLYYFNQQTQIQLVERLYDAAESGGWLLTSVTETLHNVPTRWRKVGTGLFRKL